ncbi:BPTI/Kunitz inhibitor domain-containing protein [Caenorhabditis elegans]|uniref:BPTI/Kunitz inhibitor domain-containing protein n=1 Tax=Caenorhabditis elegans TaxID=6239 RepID=Q9UAZ2_CAEEL|nr:BPTI/Kunitz inhibitor domain-containing protein [Caenorhabditis elegans]CCD61496.1 BPTI/Kunitz inhibitor domain-containing protein [Caenorhabditis elegans]|eukprot:NP_504413.1 Uncharacterized protein CELE_Y49G5A.1 [Caenorhabditis elegans]
MNLLLTFLATILCVSELVSTLQPECKLPLDMGKTPCKNGKKEIRYHFDQKSNIPLAFEYSGCGGNKNNFKTESECRFTCTGYDQSGCAAGSKPINDKNCQTDEECGPKGICRYSNHINICCDKKIEKLIEADYEPKCPKGKKVAKIVEGGIPTTIVGKSCKSKFCPAGATCVEGTYFATCCN